MESSANFSATHSNLQPSLPMDSTDTQDWVALVEQDSQESQDTMDTGFIRVGKNGKPERKRTNSNLSDSSLLSQDLRSQKKHSQSAPKATSDRSLDQRLHGRNAPLLQQTQAGHRQTYAKVTSSKSPNKQDRHNFLLHIYAGDTSKKPLSQELWHIIKESINASAFHFLSSGNAQMDTVSTHYVTWRQTPIDHGEICCKSQESCNFYKTLIATLSHKFSHTLGTTFRAWTKTDDSSNRVRFFFPKSTLFESIPLLQTFTEMVKHYGISSEDYQIFDETTEHTKVVEGQLVSIGISFIVNTSKHFLQSLPALYQGSLPFIGGYVSYTILSVAVESPAIFSNSTYESLLVPVTAPKMNTQTELSSVPSKASELSQENMETPSTTAQMSSAPTDQNVHFYSVDPNKTMHKVKNVVPSPESCATATKAAAGDTQDTGKPKKFLVRESKPSIGSHQHGRTRNHKEPRNGSHDHFKKNGLH